jgi:hypothetical protein
MYPTARCYANFTTVTPRATLPYKEVPCSLALKLIKEVDPHQDLSEHFRRVTIGKESDRIGFDFLPAGQFRCYLKCETNPKNLDACRKECEKKPGYIIL